MDPQISPKEAVLVTGGGGYFGFRLGCALNQKGIRVILFDINCPAQGIPEGIKFVHGNICHFSDVEKAFQAADFTCVFHVASYGMSGREQLNHRLIEDVNVRGTVNILQACQRSGVPRLVYTSTFNVIFGGQVIRNGDESLPYFPLHLQPDHYSRTKSIAEKKVLEANGTVLERGDGVLRTCALRSAGIYGPGEQRHLPRIVSYLERGLFRFVYGDPRSLVEFVHVDNLVQAHFLASEALKADKGHIASGQPYFISDGRPVNNFEFFRPLVEGLGYTFPSTRLPLTLIYCFAFLTEMTHFVLGRFCDFQPFLTRTEVYKTGVTHYFSLEKARRELGYTPQPFDFQEVVEWFKAHGHGRSAGNCGWESCVWDALLVFLLGMAVLTWLPPSVILSL
ncbi:short-chain dehydrogenase/reductase family 42E member 1 isoform X2 [Tupaia chinensis]|uniref:Short-chain dehydrogenase/reductase family 42E member 1 n=2 Tax=Tupaia chinensis TaxID=246437 RepID=L9KP72_TUPCH|nr:short-chain dehydrogenase/reductase family 42E member 1 isoform X2 [Tupaia chinensis]XP_027629292.1 short-chain dehydrogenase/reductase family 42E member 1 isoform X2 [Tupaia chinensis]ELW62962.1 Short-chain dehydrogenase/reductase family 42E member 1 [Tupaia chinensis]